MIRSEVKNLLVPGDRYLTLVFKSPCLIDFHSRPNNNEKSNMIFAYAVKISHSETWAGLHRSSLLLFLYASKGLK